MEMIHQSQRSGLRRAQKKSTAIASRSLRSFATGSRGKSTDDPPSLLQLRLWTRTQFFHIDAFSTVICTIFKDFSSDSRRTGITCHQQTSRKQRRCARHAVSPSSTFATFQIDRERLWWATKTTTVACLYRLSRRQTHVPSEFTPLAPHVSSTLPHCFSSKPSRSHQSMFHP